MAPQFPSQYPPAFQQPLLQTQPLLSPTLIAPGYPTGPAGGVLPPWTPPIAPPPAQAHPPGAFPTNFGVVFGAQKTFEFFPTLSVSEQWTDNFNFTATNHQTNYRTTVSPGGSFVINGPTTRGVISSSAGLTYDTAPSSSNFNVFPTITAALQQTFSPRLSLTLTDSYSRNNNPTYGDQFGLNRQRQDFTSNSFSAAITYLIDIVTTQAYYRNSLYYTGGSSNGNNTIFNVIGASASTQVGLYNTVTLGYEFSWSDTSGTSAGINSGKTTGNLVTASVARQTGTYSSVGIQGSYQQATQPNEDDVHIWNVSLFSTYGFPSGLSLSTSLGVSQFEQGDQSSTGITSNSNLTYRFGPAGVSLGVFSGFRQTGLDTTGANFGVVETHAFTGSFFYSFTPLIAGSLGATYSENSPTGAGNSNSASNQNNLSAYANLSWQLLRWLNLSANYSYQIYSGQNGSLTGTGSVSVNTATITLGATF
jgi:hypothetical protein